MIELNFFTQEQESSIPLYKEKWKKIALSNQLINQQNATEAIKNAYRAMGKRPPIIEFCSSPQDALNKITSDLENSEQSLQIPIREMSWQKWLLLAAKWTFMTRDIRSGHKNQALNKIITQLSLPGISFLKQKITALIPNNIQDEEVLEAIYRAMRQKKAIKENEELSNFPDRSKWSTQIILETLINNYLPNEARSQLYEEYWQKSDRLIESVLSKQITPTLFLSIPQFHHQSLTCIASWLDFCFERLHLPHNQKKWLAFKSIVKECGWILIYQKYCYICERPTKIYFDENNLIHSENNPAIQFADGFNIWVNHDVELVQK